MRDWFAASDNLGMPNSRGFFAIGVFHAKKEENVGTLLRTAQAFGAAFTFTIGRRYERQAADVGKSFRHVPLFHFKDYDELSHHLPYRCPLIAVENGGDSSPLPEFKHPVSAVYLLGAEDHGLPSLILQRSYEVVEIPGGKHCLNVATAGSIVMYDRYVKQNWGHYQSACRGGIGPGEKLFALEAVGT